jgi:peptidoglycan-associated lipoprotein
MKKRQRFFLLTFIGALCMLQSCTRNSDDVWEDTKSAGRHFNRGVRAMGGKYGDSRQIHSREDFEGIDEDSFYPEVNFQDCDYQDSYSDLQDHFNEAPPNDFIPIVDPSNELSGADMVAPPPRETPGEQGSSIPPIQAFLDPSTIPQLAGIFRPIYFEYDSSLVKGAQNLQTIHAIADFLRYHPNVYVTIEGHTDERGPQAYNFALGSRRANAVRNLLLNEGIHPDRMFTISYGKERPVILERHEEGWAKNRRDEFKIYER